MEHMKSTGKAEKLYSDTIGHLQYAKERIASNSPFDVEPAMRIIEEIVDEPDLIKKISPLCAKDIYRDDYMLSHQANVMIYALQMGMGLKYSKVQLIELGLASLLHDVGMFTLPRDIMFKSGKLDPSEIEIMRSHVKKGRDILSFQKEYPYLSEIAYQHHERLDGSGYPRGIDGSDINEYAQVLCLVDCYEAMVHNRPNRKALNQTFSAQVLIKKTEFQPNIIKTFLEEITLYPLGSYVLLNNNRIGIVVAINNSNPLRPDVKICFDQHGNKVSNQEIIRLKNRPSIFIEESLSSDALPAN